MNKKQEIFYKHISRIWNMPVPDTRPKREVSLELGREIRDYLNSLGFRFKLKYKGDKK